MSNILDKIALWRRSIADEFSFGDHKVIFQTEDAGEPLVLKFSYPGNVQYHSLSKTEIKHLAEKLNMFLENGKIK